MIRASEYLQRFHIEIRHKPGKANIVPDTLSRLASRDYESKDSYNSELDTLTVDAFSVSLIQVSKSFKERVKQGYQQDPRWQRIMATLLRNKELDNNTATLPYEFVDDLLYCKTDPSSRAESGLRLYIPSSLE